VNTTYTANYTLSGSVQNPFGGTAWPIPGKIEIEDFDTGGEGIAYHDATTGNSGNGYRTTENVDLEGCSEGGFNIGYVAAGEWLEYTVNVTSPGTYLLAARVSTPGAGKTFHIELDGQNISGTIAVPNTGGWQAWQTVTVTTPALTAGTKVLRVALDATDFNINFLTFTATGGTAPSASITSPANNANFAAGSNIVINANATDTDGTIAKVEFFNGAAKLGEDITSPYSFTWNAVSAGAYTLTARATDNAGLAATSSAISINVTATTGKPIPGTVQAENWDAMNGVQTEGTADAGDGQNVGWVDTGDWIDYNVNVSAAGSYTVGFRVASAPGGGQIQLRSGTTILASVDIPATGGWQTWTTLTTTANLTAGNQTLRIFAATGNWNLNWIDFTSSGDTPPVVNITSPANNASFTAPASVTIQATASASNRTIVQVQFYNGTTLLGTDTTSPYSYVWNNVAAGTYSITAKATDSAGGSTTSSAISISVTSGTTTNLALNKTTKALTSEGAAFAANFATDGSLSTRWSSEFQDPQWIYVDLGATYTINRVKITWEAAYGKNYNIETSPDESAWSLLKPVTGNTALVNDHTGLSASTRYLRIYGTARGTGYGYSIFELEVYGSSSGRENVSAKIEKAADEIQFYPNPVDKIVTIEGAKDGTDVLLSSSSGNEVFKTKISNHSIDIGHLPSGIYIIDFHDGLKPVRYKLMKR
jgi:hypothetical protein